MFCTWPPSASACQMPDSHAKADKSVARFAMSPVLSDALTKALAKWAANNIPKSTRFIDGLLLDQIARRLTASESIAHGKTCTHIGRSLEFIDECDRIVFHRDGAASRVIDKKLIFAETEFTRAFPRSEEP